MDGYTVFIPLLLLIAGAVAAGVFFLLRACEEITCAFGPLDSQGDLKHEMRRAVSYSSELHRRGALACSEQNFVAGDDLAPGHSSPATRKSFGEKYVQRRLSRAY